MRLLSSAASLVLLSLLLALPGCGGGGGDSPSTSATSTSTAEQGTTTEQPQPSQPKSKPSSSNPPRQHVPTGHPTPGAKAVAPGVPTTKGGDNSIQAFGSEGEEDPREEAISNLTVYLEARLAGEWERACALVSAEFRDQLEQLIENAKGKDKPKGCPGTLALFTPEDAKAELRERSLVSEVLSFRVEGEYAFLIFKGAEGKAMFIAMAEDDGQWRVNVPEPEAFAVGSGQ